MARPRLLDTKIPTKAHNRAEQIDMHSLTARPGVQPAEPPFAAMPARAPGETVAWWWRWLVG